MFPEVFHPGLFLSTPLLLGAIEDQALLSVSTEVDLLAVKKELQENGFETREIRKRWIPGETIYVYECGPSRICGHVRGEARSEAGQE